MSQPRPHTRTTRLVLRSAAWTLGLVAWSASCSVYTDTLLLTNNGGSGGTGASGDEPTEADGGRPPSQAGRENGGTTGVPEPGGPLGSSSSTGASAATAGAPDDGAGGDGGPLGQAGHAGEGEVDQCPDDQHKVEPGACGCGVAETCAELKAALVHRYDFSEAGTVAVDTVGAQNGTIVGASAAAGKLAFDGTTVAYVDLPNGMISALGDASFEIWLEWQGGALWQRIFDFGVSDKGEGNQGYYPKTYLSLSPSDGRPGNALCATFSSAGLDAETRARTAAALTTGSVQHLVVVVDDTKDELRLYSNGTLAASTTFTDSLSSLDDVNNWLGRSNYRDGPLHATIDEFRIYEVALDARLVAASNEFGPNPDFL